MIVQVYCQMKNLEGASTTGFNSIPVSVDWVQVANSTMVPENDKSL
jgi:hypothetical protein